MTDFVAVAMTVLALTMQVSGNVKTNDNSPQFNHKGVGIADVYQGKGTCGLTVGLIPEGTVSLFLLSLDGKMVAPPKEFSSPGLVWPDFEVPATDYYRMVAVHKGDVEVHLVYICI